MMNPILPDFERTVKKLRLNTPVLPYISDVTGRWISAEEATDPEYWARHIRETVNFRDGMSRLLEQKDTLFIEVGPGNALSTFLRQHKDKRADHFVLNLVRHPREDMADEYYLLNKVGQLWLYGVDMDWRGFYGQKKRYRLPLPAYPFERCRFFLDTALLSGGMGMGSRSPAPSEEEGGEKTGEPGKTSETVNASLHPRPNLTKPYAAPRTATERKLANIWQNFFGFLSIGSDDNFFELGGDSLNAATVLARIHRELGVKIPLAEVFNSPTLKELAQYIDKGAKSSYAELEAAEEKMYYPLSPAQKRLYILHQFDESSIAYNMLFILSVAEDIDKNHLEQTFSKLINRHESLRTSFTAAAGEPVQKIHDPRDIRFNIEYYEPKPDVGARRAVPGDGAAAGLISRFVRPFDLSEAPLLRVGLIKEAEAKYVLMVDMHHIITDGTSQDLLARDFGVLYSGMELLPLRLQYKDYSEWRQSREMRIALAGQEEFWLDEFAEKAPVLNLPTDFSRPPMQSFAGRLARFELDMAETKKLKEIAQGENATLFMVLLAVYNIFLSKLSSQEDIVVGTAAAGRGHTDLEKIIGMFVNTLALRNFPAGEKSFLLFLNELREKTIKAFENDGFQFEDLLEKMDVKRDMSRNPLFDVMFVFQNYYDASGTREIQREEKEENLKIRPYRYEQGISKLDLTLTASERGDKLFFRVEYCTKLFREETIDRFMNYFKNLVNALVKDPGLKISEIEIIPDQEKNRILVEFNDTVVDFPPGKTLPGLFAEQAGRTPDHAALAFEDKLLTYHYLDSCAGLWAEKIKKAGVQREHIVALMVENGPETVIGMTAIMKAGGAFLPIEPTYPQERKNYLLRDSHAGVLVTTGNLLNGLDNVGNLAVETVFIEAGIREGAPRAAPLKCPSPEPEGLAYAIYTSGSTGKPKGVLVRHNNIVNQLLGLQERYAFETGLHHILLAPFTFDPSVQQIFLPLFTGGKLHVVPKSIKEDPAALFFYIVSRRMDIVNTVPSLMELLLHQTADYKGLSFKYIILAGEIFSPALHQKLTDNLAVDTLINIYGPTEATINTTLYECGPEETGIPIGKPLLNYRVFILDGYLNLQPVGLTGEICIAGAGIARGYLNRPELTAEKFVSAHHAELLYKTGDLGKWLPDGNLQFLGRIDQQVKVRGIRVELGEIENRLLSHAKIEKAVVMAKKYKGDSVDLCAYFVTEPLNESVLSINDIRQFLKEKLPDFMVPSYFKQLEDIPLTKHGKVDLNALPEIGPGSIKSEIAYVAPVSDIEITIAGVWQDILQLEKVGIDDNFFDLGGNSFDIIKVNSKLQEVYEKNLRVVSMFKYPTVRSLAAYFSQSEEEPVSTVIDRSKALERGEKGRTQRRQMRKKQGIKK
jgi:amino acid adenylation domain-containing protein